MTILGGQLIMNQSVVFRIYKDSAKLYEDHRKFIRCFSGECLIRVMCCQEKKAPKSAKNLAYTIRLQKPCEDIHYIFTAIETIPRLEQLKQKDKNEYKKHLRLHEALNQQLKIISKPSPSTQMH